MEMLFKPVFSTKRMDFILMNQAVYDQIFSGHSSEEELMHFFGFSDPDLLKIERDRYAIGLSTYNRTFCWFQLRDKTDGKLLGHCGFHTVYPVHQRAELFYSLLSDEYKQKGLMTEALVDVLKYGFTTLDLYRIEALTATYNKASFSLLLKFGFQYEGTLRSHYKVGDKLEDSVILSLVRTEYELEEEF
jgi:[ribosomal protein S5]-alanine N-acetyltransferase